MAPHLRRLDIPQLYLTHPPTRRFTVQFSHQALHSVYAVIATRLANRSIDRTEERLLLQVMAGQSASARAWVKLGRVVLV